MSDITVMRNRRLLREGVDYKIEGNAIHVFEAGEFLLSYATTIKPNRAERRKKK